MSFLNPLVKEVKTRLPPDEVYALIRSLSLILSGLAPDPHGIRLPFWSAVAHSLYTDIHRNFLLKSNHQTDELGDRWADHAEKTKAYSRKDARQGLPLPGPKRRPTLTVDQDRAWRYHYAQSLSFFRTHLKEDEAKQAAGSSAWAWVKEHMDATTLLQLTANKELALLRVTGRLLTSITPNPLTPGSGYVQTVQEQVFIVDENSVTIGSTTPYAARVASSRPLWPQEIGPWKKKALHAGSKALTFHLQKILA